MMQGTIVKHLSRATSHVTLLLVDPEAVASLGPENVQELRSIQYRLARMVESIRDADNYKVVHEVEGNQEHRSLHGRP